MLNLRRSRTLINNTHHNDGIHVVKIVQIRQQKHGNGQNVRGGQMKYFLIIFMLAVLLAIVVGCSGESTTPAPNDNTAPEVVTPSVVLFSSYIYNDDWEDNSIDGVLIKVEALTIRKVGADTTVTIAYYVPHNYGDGSSAGHGDTGEFSSTASLRVDNISISEVPRGKSLVDKSQIRLTFVEKLPNSNRVIKLIFVLRRGDGETIMKLIHPKK